MKRINRLESLTVRYLSGPKGFFFTDMIILPGFKKITVILLFGQLVQEIGDW